MCRGFLEHEAKLDKILENLSYMYKKAWPEFFIFAKIFSSSINPLPNSVEGVKIQGKHTISFKLQINRGGFLEDEKNLAKIKNSGHAFLYI